MISCGLNPIYKWVEINKMQFNAGKFQTLTLTNSEQPMYRHYNARVTNSERLGDQYVQWRIISYAH